MNDLYEKHKLYRGNPCDRDAHPVLRPFGRAVATLASHCACCSGSRILLAMALGAAFRAHALVALAAILVALTIKETFWPTE